MSCMNVIVISVLIFHNTFRSVIILVRQFAIGMPDAIVMTATDNPSGIYSYGPDQVIFLCPGKTCSYLSILQL